MIENVCSELILGEGRGVFFVIYIYIYIVSLLSAKLLTKSMYIKSISSRPKKHLIPK